MRLRLALILPPALDPWRAYNLRRGFGEIARQATMEGWLVEIVDLAYKAIGDMELPPGVSMRRLTDEGPTILAGPGSASATAPLKEAHRLWRHLADSAGDVVLAPLAGGVLQACLMSRALGESLRETAFVLWADAPAAMRLRSGGGDRTSVRFLVEDALERQCLRMVDAVVGPTDEVLVALGSVETERGVHITGALPAPQSVLLPEPRSGGIEQIAFVGPATEGYGLRDFLEAIERMAKKGQLDRRRVAFVGPWRASGPGLSKAQLGVRAASWPFEFEVVDTNSAAESLSWLRSRGAAAVFAGAATDDDVLVEETLRAGIPIVLSSHHRLARRLENSALVLSPSLAGLERAFEQEGGLRTATMATNWPALLASVAERAPASAVPDAPPTTAAVCITHADRSDDLVRATASARTSAPISTEIIVADVGSVANTTLERLAGLEREGVTVLRLGPAPQGRACDSAAAATNADILVFLDDDNAFLEDGCARLIGAVSLGAFDIVVSNLRLYDGPAAVGTPAADHVFLGDAGSAGLFFNGFGDVSFAIRRVAFESVGGFGAYDGPCLDWVFLARARAAGLKIGVLQQPAVAYARDLTGSASKWRKQDHEGARSSVLAAYAGTFDAALVAGLAQAAFLDQFYP